MKRRMFAFSKQNKLLKAFEFKQVLKKAGVKLILDPFVVYAVFEEKKKLGLTVPNRHCRHIVQRNTIKRLIRESFRLNILHCPPASIVVMSRSSIDGLNEKILRKKIDSIWPFLQKKHQAFQK